MSERGHHDKGRVCVCVSEHRPAPLELERHHIWPLGMGGPDTDWNIAWLCPIAHMNTHELMREILKGNLTTFRSATDAYEQPVNRYCWDLAVEGIKRITEHTVLGVEEEDAPEATTTGPIPDTYLG